MSAANQRRLRVAVEALARNDVDEHHVSEAINAFGQVLADLTQTDLRLAVITGDALEIERDLRRKIVELETQIRLYNLQGMTKQ